jgi:hypothetical protein
MEVDGVSTGVLSLRFDPGEPFEAAKCRTHTKLASPRLRYGIIKIRLALDSRRHSGRSGET